jgi:hypothetical protein
MRKHVSSSIKRTSRLASAWAIVLASSLGACSESREADIARSIGAPVRIERERGAPHLFASSAERFGMSMPGSVKALAAAFEYATPAGWRELPPTEMRAVNFEIGDKPGTECYVTVLGGDGGGALANVNRWCGQLKVTPWTEEQLAAAPRLAMFGADAVLVVLGGDGQERMLIGALARLESRSVFVKLTGARADVLAQRAAFEAFCKSLASKSPSSKPPSGKG